MDDNLKIQALAIYYKHWGNEQNHKRKIIHGFSSLKQHISKYAFDFLDAVRRTYDIFLDDEEEVASLDEHIDKLKSNPSFLFQCLQKCFDDEPFFGDEDERDLSLDNCSCFSELLLGECAGLDYLKKDLPTEGDLLRVKKNAVEEFCDMTEEASDIMYDDDFTEQHVLSVQAIVALM